MKKFGKITAALLALVMVMSLFAACSKDDNNEEETTTEGFTLQLNSGEGETTEESTTQAESTTEVTTKEEKTTKVKVTVKVPSITKAPSATKAPSTTKVPDTTKAPGTTKAPATTNIEENNTTVAQTTKPAVPEEEETLSPNGEKLVGRWEASYVVEGITIYMQMEFKHDNSVVTELTKSNYDKMINEIIEEEISIVTKEELTEAGFADVTEYKEALLEYLHEELPFDELKPDFRSAGTWKLEGNTLSVTFDGETATSEFTGGNSFGMKFPEGEPIKLVKTA